VTQGDLRKVKKDFHLEIKSKGGKCKGATRGENPTARNRRTNFWVVVAQFVVFVFFLSGPFSQ
jgi:hypothetical protein